MSINRAYVDLLAAQDQQLNKLHQDHYVACERIKQMQQEHFDQTKYAVELERLEKAHAQEVKAVKARFEKEKQVLLKETPTPERKLEPEKPPAPEISDNQDLMTEMMVAKYRRKQQERQQQKGYDRDGPEL
ncbi:hypothetical protein [Fibrella forsythiae]|uniref:Uncharacterized protein n=1 Tax=Fibrella forsythiae TaxID=2817061 RepID=A0ABS3JKR1_9BACT|nr:hypothetical protein [Fibrella forsythiae]MBO0950585.1 hypothetical protein [Fibrella forsythiae]